MHINNQRKKVQHMSSVIGTDPLEICTDPPEIIVPFCYILGVKITTWDGREDTATSFRCATVSRINSTVTWTLTTDAGVTQHLGTCHDVKNCTLTQTGDATVSRPVSTYSDVSFGSMQRNMGLLSCSLTYQGITDTDSRQLNTYCE